MTAPTTSGALDAVRDYLAAARWFGGKGRDFTLDGVRRVGTLPSPASSVEDGPVVGIELVGVRYVDGDVETYQMPLAYYAEAQDRLEHALVGTWDDDDLGAVHAYDAMHDRESTALYLQAFDAAAADAELDQSGQNEGDLAFRRIPGHDLDLTTHSTLFSGEQSNSSLAFGEDALMKVFRKVTPGRNPDVVIHDALTRSGSEHVAALYGWLEVTGAPGEDPTQLAMLQQFLRTASDGWELALASVRDLFAEADLHADEVGGDFAGEAERLGLATAQVHDVLAAQFPTESWGSSDLQAVADGMLTRLESALAIVPQLVPYADALRVTFSRVADLGAHGQSASAQRVHGDFHLGQTLRTVRGWKIVDFEGEPAKPLAERVRPDLVWRDVAGMLRSFDYAAHAVEADMQGDPEGASQIAFRAAEWGERNTAAFIRGYVDNSGRTTDGKLSDVQWTVLQAYVADKAVYEAVYEARNRPTWLSIPLGAIARITGVQTTGADAPATRTSQQQEENEA